LQHPITHQTNKTMLLPSILTSILLLPVAYNLLFPFRRPRLDNYFSPGQTFTSEAEGVTQTVIRQEGNRVYSELTFAPHAAGPPEHLHRTLDESLSVVKGTLTTKVGGQVRRAAAGERIVLRKGVYHRLYNETGEEVVLRSVAEEDYIPVELAYSLAQLYPLMKTGGGLSLKMFAKICVLDNAFDTVPAGLPPAFFSILVKAAKPYARLFGVTPYDHRSRPAQVNGKE
jgi:quercetin dioxygenase-like cupin family protein